MKKLEEIKNTLQEHKNELKEKYGVIRIGIFGSVARNEQREESDIDILVELERPMGLRFVNLAYYLEEFLGQKVEVVTLSALKQKPRLLKSVEEDIVYV